VRQIVRRLVPRRWKPSFDAVAALAFDYGHLRSGATGTSIDASATPIPWYTYPAIEYLRQIDFAEADVFEYGSGHSTLFWASRARSVTSVEDDRAWFDSLSRRLPPNCELILEPDLYAYPGVIERTGRSFDVIVIDGAARGNTRLKCARRALNVLRAGGLIILDNADWLPESARVLRTAGLIQVDMTGFGPVNGYTWTTTLFLHRACALRPRSERQPEAGTGSWPQTWERPPSAEPPVVVCGDDTYGGVVRNESFAMDGPNGPETFRFIVSESPNIGVRWVAILDDRRQRVLLALSEPTGDAPRLERQFERLTRRPWAEFQRSINTNDQRRYDLEPTAGGTP
jgi:Methyltransferase domain